MHGDGMKKEPGERRFKKKIVIGLAVGVLAAAGVSVVLDGYTPFYRAFLQAPSEPGFAEHVEGISGIDYIARINPGLYRGAYPLDNLKVLQKLGINTIINFRYMEAHDYGDQARAAGFKYHWMPIYPGEPPDRESIEKFLRIVNNPENRPVYIHCNKGIDRTGLMAGIYRIEHDGWKNARAVREMEYFGHNELWHDLEEKLKSYEPGPGRN
ncbi:MAG: tyrosine-protein phosphatase [bacterium]